MELSEGLGGDVREHPFSGGGTDNALNYRQYYMYLEANLQIKCKTEKNG